MASIPRTGIRPAVKWAHIVTSLGLSPPDPIPPQTEPPRFVYGITWVEALYPYLQSSAKKTGQDWSCSGNVPSRQAKGFLTTAKNCAVNYVFNWNLVEKHKDHAKGRARS